MPHTLNDESCNYLFNFPWILLSVVPTTGQWWGAVVAQRGSNGWKVNPNIVGGKINKICFIGVPGPGTAGPHFGFS